MSGESSDSEEEDVISFSEDDASGSPSAVVEVVSDSLPPFVQKKCKYISKHPNPDETNRLVQEEILKIKHNLSCAVVTLELSPGFMFWLDRLWTFLNLYGLHFSREDHIYLVELLAKVATNLDLEPATCQRVLSVMNENLLRGFYLKPGDLSINWRPWYDLYFKYYFGYDSSRHILIHPGGIDSSVAKCIILLQKFFSIESTEEILNEVKQYLVPTSLVHSSGIRLLTIFLPTYLPVGQESRGYKLWFDDLVETWTEHMNTSTNEDIDLITLFRRLSRHNMGLIDWEPFLPKLYTRLLRYFGISLSLPRSVGVSSISRSGTADKSGNVIRALADLVVNTIDRNNSALAHLNLLFSSLHNYYHPSNLVGGITTRLTFFMGSILKRFLERVISEREEKDRWNMRRQPQESFLTENQIKEFVSIVEPSVLLSLFIKGPHQGVGGAKDETNPQVFVQMLAILSPETVIPDIFDKLHTALSSVTEPHQLTASLMATAYICPSIITEIDRFPGGRLKLLQLLPQFIPAIDSNDPMKLATVTALLSAMAFQIPFVNCAQAGLYNENLTEEELELCHFTASFEEILLQIVKQYILVFNSMRSVENFMEVSSGAAQNATAALKSVGSSVINSLTSCLTSLIANSSKDIAKLLIQEMFNYISTTIINVNSGFGFISKTFTLPALHAHPEIAGPLYVPHVLDKLRQLAVGHNLVSETEVDKEFLWYAAVFEGFSNLRTAKYEPELFECLQLLLKAKHVDIYKKACNVLYSVITVRLVPHVAPTYWLGRRRAGEGLDSYVPILDFGKSMEFSELQLDWKEPDDTGVAFIQKLVNEILTPTVEKISTFTKEIESVESSKSTSSSDSKKPSMSREELLKDLSIIHSFIDGLACTLTGLDSEHILTLSENCDMMPHLYGEENLVKSFKLYNTLRKEVALKLHDLLTAMLSDDKQENDTKSLVMISKTLRLILLNVGGKAKLRDSLNQTRNSKNHLIGKKRFKGKRPLYIPMEVNEVIIHYQLTRTWRRTPGLFGPTCLLLCNDVYKLATSRYPAVRTDSQHTLSTIMHVYKYSSRLFIPLIEKTLLSPKSYHQYKGALHALCVAPGGGNTLIEIQDFEVVHKLWLAVLNCYSPLNSEDNHVKENGTSENGNLNGIHVDDEENMDIDSTGDAAVLAREDSTLAKEDPSEFSKRKTVLSLLKSIYARIATNCTTISIYHKLDLSARELALKYLRKQGDSAFESYNVIEEFDTANAVQDAKRLKEVESIIEDVCALLEKGKAHACVQTTALRVLHYMCLRRDWPTHTPVRVAKLAFEATLSETAAVRQSGYLITRLVLEINKIAPLKGDKPLYQLYNSTLEVPLSLSQCEQLDEKTLKTWNMYSKGVELDAKAYNKRQFLDRNYFIYNCKASEMMKYVSATPQEQSEHFCKAMENYSALHNFIVSWFSNQSNVEPFVKHLSAEEKKVGVNYEGNSRETGKFCRYKIWQFLFRLMGEKAFDIFDKSVQKVVAETKDSSHRFLAEFCCGALHASRYWSYEQCQKCKDYILPIFDAKMSAVSDDTKPTWDNFFTHALKDFDPMRVQWFFEWIFDKLRKTIHEDKFTKQGVMMAQTINHMMCYMSYESNSLKERHMEFMLGFTGNRFTKYRAVACQSVSSCLAYYNQHKSWCMSTHSLMDTRHLCEELWLPVAEKLLDPSFEAPLSADDNSAHSESAILLNKVNSIAQIVSTLQNYSCFYHRSASAYVYPLLSYIALVDGLDPEPDHVKIATQTVQRCALAPMLDPSSLGLLEASIKKMSGVDAPWRSRRLVLVFFQQLALSNLFLLMQPSSSQLSTPALNNGEAQKLPGRQLLDTIQSVIIKLLKDDKLEVRELACSTLSGYIHCGVTQVDRSLIRKFTKLRASKLNKANSVKSTMSTSSEKESTQSYNEQTANTSSLSSSSSNSALVQRHAGVLGLKACINAYPYSVPDWMPGVLMSLADHVCDPTPIEGTVRDTLMDFKRTHHDNWTKHKESFSEDQLNTLNDILISPSYYV